MELGITTFAEVTGAGVTPGERLRQVVEEAVLAEQVGLSVYGVGEHHRPDLAVSAPAIVLATIAGRTERIRLSSAVTVLASADPVRAFQDFVTLDLLSSGRAELMVGRGSFTGWFPRFGSARGDDDALFAEKLELLLALRAGGPTTWGGELRAPLDGIEVHPRSERALPVWLAVGGTPESVVRAGTLGLPVALAIIGGCWASFAPHADLYRRALDYGQLDRVSPLAVHSHGYVCLDEAAGRAEFLPAYRATFDTIGRERGCPPMSDAAVEAVLAPEGALFFGHPERVADKIVTLTRTLGLQRFELHASHVGHAATMRSIELFGTQVAPLVAERLAA
ncbi:MAG TPA: LLM class flavin-dependent oxidoreductase [Friedmanniella sp.]